MATRVRSLKGEQRARVQGLRQEGATWVEIADLLGREYGLNARTAFRLAHGWSQLEAAEHWNQRWPDDPRTFKNFSYWEQWPASTGYTPSLDVLGRLAELYGCRVGDLLADAADHRDVDPMHRARPGLQHLPGALAHLEHDHAGVDGDAHDGAAGLEMFVTRLQEADVSEIAEVAGALAQHIQPEVDRRALLAKLGFALSMAAAAPDSIVHASTEHPSAAGLADLSGVWRSRYAYFSSGRREHFEAVHYVVVRQQERQLSIDSLPHSTGSRLRLSLTLDAFTATGTWEERTSSSGYYKGATYRGAIQLLISPPGDEMTGKWLGFGKNFAINSGDWEFALEDRSTTRTTLRTFHMKA